uniref:Uncharacterized protein n=1 Tax=Nonomuraea gerenzanensis TaxID=93944 RepID=A0A1M4ELS4_9ACTN|nr:hypothetical protein BN4615_P9039 [Nonomuraea gerenzanensis]
MSRRGRRHGGSRAAGGFAAAAAGRQTQQRDQAHANHQRSKSHLNHLRVVRRKVLPRRPGGDASERKPRSIRDQL